MIIAVDGPAASGKGTIAAALGRHFNLPHLDTGLLYRAVGLAVKAHIDAPDIEARATKAAQDLDSGAIDPEYLLGAEVGVLASPSSSSSPIPRFAPTAAPARSRHAARASIATSSLPILRPATRAMPPPPMADFTPLTMRSCSIRPIWI